MTKQKYINGDCYIASAKFLLDNHYIFTENHTPLLCHGVVTGTSGPNKGKQFGHAWIEAGDVFIDCANDKIIEGSKELYYAIGNINPDSVNRYSVRRVREMLIKYETYGPWG